MPKRAIGQKNAGLLLRGLAVAVILMAVGWIWLIARAPEKPAGPVFIFALDPPGPNSCPVDLRATLDQTIQRALRDIPGSSIVIGDPKSLPMELTDQIFTLEKVISCSDQSTRLTLTLTRVASQELALVHRYNIHAITQDELGNVIMADVSELITQ